ncbi:hypothetical protein B0H16DRAFT_1720713 [Mycena metata]|uniref:Protein kinase domain-containing protein n=1 Tax=Mycena metata TaxID=1033252 RepID=A0AAD7J8Q3_9AGAR|nr:hypothetical protein B0H16DRAFT_1720713 [Mycena metata]
MAPDGPPNGSDTSFVVDADHQILGTGAAVSICYDRNLDFAECPENTALDDEDGNGLEDDVIERLREHTIHPLLCLLSAASYRFSTAYSQSRDAEASDGPFYPDARVLPASVSLPSVFLSSLRATHRLRDSPHILLVKTKIDDDVRVLKMCQNGGSHLIKEAGFMARLPETDFLVRSPHVVVDETGLFHGLLNDFHPASSLRIMTELLHPNAVPSLLPPSSDDRGRGSLAGVSTSITWGVKLAWATEIAAAVVWLQRWHGCSGCMRRTSSGRISRQTTSYCAQTWCPPEVQPLGWEGTVEGDVFALGLVLWCVAVEVGSGQREQDYVSPRLLWAEGIPDWFQSLVSSCLEHEPGRRPSTSDVYETLRIGDRLL